MLLEMEPRIFDLDLQTLHDCVLTFIALPVIVIFILGSAVITKFLIKKLREK